MIVACKLPNGLVLSDGVVLRGAMIGHEDHQRAGAPGRERIAGYEITRNVPDDVWGQWFAQNAPGPIVQKGLVMGFADGEDQELASWCWQHHYVRGWMQASNQ